MCDILKKEFRLKNVWFGHHRQEDFYSAQWQWHPAIYIAYRTIVACYSVACFLAYMIPDGSGRSFAFLTIWTYLLLCLYQLSALFVSIYYRICRRGDTGPIPSGAILMKANINIASGKDTELALQNPSFSDGSTKLSAEKDHKVLNGVTENETGNDRNSVPDLMDRATWCMKLSWFLANMLYAFGVLVTVVYFAAVHKGGTNIHDLNLHAFNTVQILLDIAIVARPVRLLHAVYPLMYGVCYIVFSVIFWSQDKVYNVVYPNVIDWNQPGTTGIVVAVLAVGGIPLLQMALFGIYRIRLYIYKRIYGTDYLDLE